jgi:hypothetical protein
MNNDKLTDDIIKVSDDTDTKNNDNDFDYSLDFSLDTPGIDTETVKRISINQTINAVVVELYNGTTCSTIQLEDFSEKTIKPLKTDLARLLEGNGNKQAIINSIVTCILSNIDKIKASQIAQQKSGPTSENTGQNYNKSNNARILVELASRKENTEKFFKDQYGRPNAAVRFGKDKILRNMPLKSKKYKHYLSKLFRENMNGEIVGEDAINNAINTLAADAEIDGQTIPIHLRVAWGQKENKAKGCCIYYDMTDEQGRIVEISREGWHIINGSDPDVPILFKRHNQTPQVTPHENCTDDIFDRFLDLTNVKNEEHRLLLKVLIVSSFIPEIDHPILTTYGPQGAAKSFLLTLIKMLRV